MLSFAISAFLLYERLKGPLGPEAAEALAGAMEDFSNDLRGMVTREDFRELKEIVADLGAAQKRAEQRVEELAEAQKRADERVAELAEAQKRTEETMPRGFADFNRRLGVPGSRWGDGAEEAFRRGLLEHVRHLGYTVEHFEGKDPEGYINGYERDYDLDILTQNGLTIVTEIKSNASGADVTEFARCVALFERQTRRKADRKIPVAVTIQRLAARRAEEPGVTVTTGLYDLETRGG